ncbi:RNA pyrophosphohydrolase [Pseudoroseicyclus tamaricis]|uniref:RNA pyrophosphohydrolase n=1 Tax=Pseudoroseicyclus tamaricis TaxID=2705421 RepID=A0A6B2JUT2_9RHOB|nr:RNA pyrophosphohydrolase [Pseudoroseicyclus tamaricis]NDV02088.1 RNA pyrophosphohydrolase [Pseudoroseicyclus tamaricis]
MSGKDYRPCVGIMLADDAGRIFLGQRADMATPAWQMPQGGIDPGEGAEEAALRELMEETGLGPDKVKIVARTAEPLRYDFPAELDGAIAKGKWRGQEQVWFLMRFRGEDADVRLDAHEVEFSDWKWAERDEIVPAIVPFKREVYARALAELEPYL